MRRILNNLGNIILTILIILLIGYGFAFFELKIMLKKYPEVFGHAFILVKDNKMVSKFYKDDIVIVKKNADYQEGEVVLVLTNKNGYMLSTVVGKDSFSTTTRCETCSKNDAPVDNSQVLGKAVGRMLFVGKLIRFFKKKIVLILLALFGVGCLIASRFVTYTPYVKKKKPEKKENNEIQS